MIRLFRRALRRTRRALGGHTPKPKLPLTRDTYSALGGDHSVPNLTGELRLSRLEGSAEGLVEHESLIVPGFGYDGMEDNDIRGHLDGTYQYAWNQASQKYVRTGRIDNLFQYGEYELFRVLQRWADLPLPEGVRVLDAQLRLQIQVDAIEVNRNLLLYAMRRDWNPGEGGTGRDNLTPPAKGEVWWNDARFGEEAWGLPGGSSPEDLDPAPLAEAVLEPGQEALQFASESLTEYVREQVAREKPLLFMIKLQDRQEDVPGSLVYIWAASEGDDRTPGRKPVLALRWSLPGESVLTRPLLIEPGRALQFPVDGANFVAVDGVEDQPVEVSARRGDGHWRRVEHGRLQGSDSEVRVRAVSNVVPFGGSFVARFRDTWVRTGPPEGQDVLCTFTSPTGRRLESLAQYEGDYTWSMEVPADEVGRWRYRWAHYLQPGVFESVEGTFDVTVESTEEAVHALREFQGDVIAAPFDDREALSRLMVRFAKLERAAVATLGSGGFDSQSGQALRDAIRSVRGGFGRPVPDPLPMEPADPHPWQTED